MALPHSCLEHLEMTSKTNPPSSMSMASTDHSIHRPGHEVKENQKRDNRSTEKNSCAVLRGYIARNFPAVFHNAYSMYVTIVSIIFFHIISFQIRYILQYFCRIEHDKNMLKIPCASLPLLAGLAQVDRVPAEPVGLGPGSIRSCEKSET